MASRRARMQTMRVVSPRRSWASRAFGGLVLVVLIGAIVLHAVGGWWVSSRIFTDALEVTIDREPAADVEVVGVDEGALTLRILDGTSGADLVGVVGMAYPGGFAGLGEIIGTGENVITRTYRVMEGDGPEVGAVGDVTFDAYPDDVAWAGEGATEVIIEGPLGRMPAWEVPGGSTWFIHVHGKGASRAEALRMSRPLAEAGYTQLIITYRNDPEAPADPSGMYGYGATESEDLEAAISYARERGAEQIVLVGYSTGAGIAMAAMLRDRDIAGAIFDAPNLDMASTIRFRAAEETLPGGLPLPFTVVEVGLVIASLRYDVNWGTVDYEQRAALVATPILVFHGTDDTSVPIDVSRAVAEARPDWFDLVEVEGAGHVASWNVDSGVYEARVLDFVTAVVNG